MRGIYFDSEAVKIEMLQKPIKIGNQGQGDAVTPIQKVQIMKSNGRPPLVTDKGAVQEAKKV